MLLLMLLNRILVHEHCVQVYLQIVKSVKYDRCDPYCVECSEVIISSTRHRYQTKFSKRLEKQTIWYPNADIGDDKNSHNETQSSHEHKIREVLEPIVFYQNISFAYHFFEDVSNHVDNLKSTNFFINQSLTYLLFLIYVWHCHLLYAHPQYISPYDVSQDDYADIQADVDEELRWWNFDNLTFVDGIGRQEISLKHIFINYNI